MTELIAPNSTQKAVKETLEPSESLRFWMIEVSKFAKPLFGTGSPEGVVDAEAGQSYIDQNPLALDGEIEWVKQLDDISGDTTKGWRF